MVSVGARHDKPARICVFWGTVDGKPRGRQQAAARKTLIGRLWLQKKCRLAPADEPATVNEAAYFVCPGVVLQP